ncbi:MAG: sulfatase [Candidatus Lernaella stagnicola]|nr:sulfatase [Candidatus Lernaella stagnicola]
MNAPHRKPSFLDLRAPLFALGLVIIAAFVVGCRQAAAQGYEGHLFWRAVFSVERAAQPWALAAAVVAWLQFTILIFVFGYRRRAALTLGTGWLLAMMLARSLPDLVMRIAHRIPPERLPVFAREPEAMGAFLNRIVTSFFLPERLWENLAATPALWIVPLLLPVLLGLALAPAWYFVARRWTTRDAMKLNVVSWTAYFAVLVVSAALPTAASALTRPETKRPDVVLISIDTLRRDMLGVYGRLPSPTPNLDRLAAQGTVAADMRAPSSWTLPSHAALLTGLRPWRLGIAKVTDRLPNTAWTLAEQLATAGYDTHAIVTHLFVDAPYGFAQGFDRMSHPPSERATEVVSEGVDYLARRGGDPAFLFLHFYDPHWPYQPPDNVPPEWLADVSPAARREVDRHDDAFALVDALRQGPPEWTAAAWALYRAEIWATDDAIGRLLEAIEQSGRPTIIAVVSDHGEMFGAHDMYGHGMTLFEGEIRVPCIVAGPGVPAGRTLDGPTSLMDVAPSILELLEFPAPTQIDGRSFVDALKTNRRAPTRWIAGENHWLSSQPVRYLCDGEWKWQSGLHDTVKGREVEYPEAWYFLPDDPDENVPFTADEPVPQLEELLQLLFAEKRAGEAPVPLSQAERERLKSLGYLP